MGLNESPELGDLWTLEGTARSWWGQSAGTEGQRGEGQQQEVPRTGFNFKSIKGSQEGSVMILFVSFKMPLLCVESSKGQLDEGDPV